MSHRNSLPVAVLQEGLKEDFADSGYFTGDNRPHHHPEITVSLTALCQALMAFPYPNKNVNTQSSGNDDLGTAQS